MADRSVRVQLSAQVQSYIDGMEKAGKATREVGSEAEKLAQQKEAFQQVGVASLAMGTLAAAGVTLAVSKWADFDQAMSNVQAATMESEANMKLLSNAALDAGARTVFSAEESANAIEELAKAGVSTADILNGALDGALDLAAAGGLGVAEAAGIAATALKTFGLEGSDMAHVADLLAAGAGKAMGDVTDLSGALNQSAMVANATGLSIEETTATLAAFASQGLLGSDAGTSFKSMLQSLTPTSAKARETMDELGISAYDAQGNFIGMAEFAGKLQNGLKDLTVEQQQAALKTIFGSDAIRAATVLYNEGEEGIRGWTEAVDDQGYAAEQAAARLDNLKGDIEALGGALDTALIKTGSGANGVLRDMVQWVTNAVDAYNELPAPLQGVTLAAGILAAGIGVLGGGILLAVPQIAAFKVALVTLGVTSASVRVSLMGITRFMLGPWGVAMAAAAIAVTVFNGAMDNSKTSAAEFEIALKQGEGALDAMRANADKNEQGLVKAFTNVGQHIDDLPALMDKAATSGRGFWSSLSFNEQAMLDNLGELGTELARIASTDLSSATDEFTKFANSAGLTKEQAALALEEMPAFKKSLLDAAEAAGLATNDSTLLALAMGDISPATAEATDATADNVAELGELQSAASDAAAEVGDLEEAIRGFGSAQFDVEEATIAFHGAVADLEEQLASGKGSLDVTTEAGRNTHSAMLDVAASTNEYAASLSATGATTDDIAAALEAGRQRIINTRIALGDSEAAAIDYANSLVATPDTVPTQVQLTGVAEAEATLAFVTRVRETLIRIKTEGGDGSGALNWNPGGSANGNLFEFANGGGLQTGIYSGGPPITRFAEPETRWEAFISGKPGQEDRNRQIWVETGERLGVMQEIRKAISGGTSHPPIYVQNPFTGEYLLARVDERADGSVNRALAPLSSSSLNDQLGVR